MTPTAKENCERKTRYASESEARSTAQHQMQVQPATPRLRVYQCSICGGWHLTSGNSGLSDKLREAFGGD